MKTSFSPSPLPSIRLGVVESQPLIRDCLVAGLEAEQGFTVAGAAANLEEVEILVGGHPPDVLLVSTAFPLGQAREALRWIRSEALSTRVVAVGGDKDEGEILSWIEAGAAGYALWTGGLCGLKEQIRAVLNGNTLCSPSIAGRLVSRLAELADRTPAPEGRPECPLTPRQMEILFLVADGLSNKEIAGRLCLSLSTIKNHIHNLLEKLGVSGRYAAVAHVRRMGWMPSAPPS